MNLKSSNPIFNWLRDHLESFSKLSNSDPTLLIILIKYLIDEVDEIESLEILEMMSTFQNLKKMIDESTEEYHFV